MDFINATALKNVFIIMELWVVNAKASWNAFAVMHTTLLSVVPLLQLAKLSLVPKKQRSLDRARFDRFEVFTVVTCGM
jgi:hypothetical protein